MSPAVTVGGMGTVGEVMPYRDVVVIGGGQSGLAAGFYLRRAGADFEILDASDAPGGAWPHLWPSLRLFSPAEFSSLPGRRMPINPDADGSDGTNPDAAHVVEYLRHYEEYYDLPVRRGVRVTAVERNGAGGAVGGAGFLVHTDGADDGDGRARTWRCRAVISATGTFSRPFVPAYPGAGAFRGEQLHSADYGGPDGFVGRRVVVVGGANSGAQIAADLAGHCELTWCTLRTPRFLPDDVDGRELFLVASAAVRGTPPRDDDNDDDNDDNDDNDDEARPTVADLGDIVAVPPVRAARDAGLLRATAMFDRLTPDGVAWCEDGVGWCGAGGDADPGRRTPAHREVDSIIWCTGFRPALGHLRGLRLPRRRGRLVADGPAVPGEPGLFLLGYGNWCGAASATLVGVGQWARAAVAGALDGA